MSTYNLWCLVDGDKTPFDVMMPVDGLISHLKESIKEKCKNGVLNGVDAKDLTLWKMSDASTRDLWPAVTLKTISVQAFERLSTVRENKMLKLLGSEQDSLINFRAKLAQHRWIESGTEDLAVLHFKNKILNFDNYFEPAPIDVEQRDRVSSKLELYHLALPLVDDAWKEGQIKETNVRWIFDKLGRHFHSILGSRESHGFGLDWPFKIIVNVESVTEKNAYRYTPRSDFRISVDGLMYLLVEVQSDTNQNDRYRMLLQAACAARLGRLLYNNLFIVVALYIENSGKVKRYFVFQRDGADPTVSYAEDSQDWNQPFQLFNAIFEIYKLASIIQNDRPQLERIEERIEILANDISNNFPHTLKPQGGNIGLGLQCNEDVYKDRQIVDLLSCAGYTLESNDEDEEGFALLNQLMHTMRHAKQSNGNAVVVKLLYSGSDELQIFHHLLSIKSPINPTIPLLRTIQSNVGTFIVLPEATPLDLGFRLGDFVNEGEIVDLSLQLIEGVAFLHRHGIAHLDIKPQNIVVLGNRLFIIDFDISVCVDGPDALINRWCGTPQWMVPEIGHQDGPRCLYSPIRADLWSCGRVLQYLAVEGAVIENPFKALMRRLLNRNPQLRPLLHLPSSSYTVGDWLRKSQAGLKRKVDALPHYAKRLAIGTEHT